MRGRSARGWAVQRFAGHASVGRTVGAHALILAFDAPGVRRRIPVAARCSECGSSRPLVRSGRSSGRLSTSWAGRLVGRRCRCSERRANKANKLRKLLWALARGAEDASSEKKKRTAARAARRSRPHAWRGATIRSERAGRSGVQVVRELERCLSGDYSGPTQTSSSATFSTCAAPMSGRSSA